MLQEFREQDYCDYENEPLLTHDEDLWGRLTQYAHLNPEKIFAMAESEEFLNDPSIDREALNVMVRYWLKNRYRGGGGEIGEPIRGEQLPFRQIRSLSEAVGQYRCEHVMAQPVHNGGDSGGSGIDETGLFDFDMLSGDPDDADKGTIEGCT